MPVAILPIRQIVSRKMIFLSCISNFNDLPFWRKIVIIQNKYAIIDMQFGNWEFYICLIFEYLCVELFQSNASGTTTVRTIVNSTTSPIFVTEIKDPCAKLNCTQGAQCVRSRDGSKASCECLESCPNLGDHEGSSPVCGTDGTDYPSLCELNKAACAKGVNITVAFQGKCGKYFSFDCNTKHLYFASLRVISCRIPNRVSKFRLHRKSKIPKKY